MGSGFCWDWGAKRSYLSGQSSWRYWQRQRVCLPTDEMSHGEGNDSYFFSIFSRMTLHYGYLLEVEFMKLHLFFLSKKNLAEFPWVFFFWFFFARKVGLLCVLERYFLENFGDHFVIPELGPCRPQKVLCRLREGSVPKNSTGFLGPFKHGCFFWCFSFSWSVWFGWVELCGDVLRQVSLTFGWLTDFLLRSFIEKSNHLLEF